jgi:hypothetical protein
MKRHLGNPFSIKGPALILGTRTSVETLLSGNSKVEKEKIPLNLQKKKAQGNQRRRP